LDGLARTVERYTSGRRARKGAPRGDQGLAPPSRSRPVHPPAWTSHPGPLARGRSAAGMGNRTHLPGPCRVSRRLAWWQVEYGTMRSDTASKKPTS